MVAWLEAFNSGDTATLRRFLAEHAPEAPGSLLRLSPQMMNFRGMTGGFTLVRADSVSTPRVVALVQERSSDQMAVISMQVATDPPHHISALNVQAVPRPPDLAIARLSDTALAAALRDRVASEAAAGRFSGAILVARDGRILYEGAAGMADRERGTANTVDTRFRVGSMNKMFTAVAILQLVQAGKIRLDDPLIRHLPDYPNRELASKVTIHQLLNHTGGTGDIFGPQFAANRAALRTTDDYLKLYGARALAWEPGSRWQYSNYGYILLGAVIERVSGQSYYDYVDRNVFTRAGMTETASLPEDTVVPRRSLGYMRSGGGGPLVSNSETLPYRGTSAGGGYSTVRDFWRFARALRSHQLLDATHTQLLTTGTVAAFGAKYAYGFVDRDISGTRIVGHGGGAPGMNGELYIHLPSGTVIAALANLDPPAAKRIADFALNRVVIP